MRGPESAYRFSRPSALGLDWKGGSSWLPGLCGRDGAVPDGSTHELRR